AGVSGTSAQVACVVTNQGSGSASGYWYDGIYFSSMAVLDTNAVVLSQVYANHSVDAGGSYAWTNTVTLPQVPAGTYYLYVVVDDPYWGLQVYEATKTNNSSAALALAAVIPALSLLDSLPILAGVSGTSVQVACVVTNQG